MSARLWRSSSHCVAVLAGLAAVWASVSAARAQPDAAYVPEDRVKAAFLYNFAKFVEWGAESGHSLRTLVIGVAGDAALARELERTIRDKTVGQRPLEVRRVEEPQELARCDLVFLGWTDASRRKRALEALGHARVLTVGEAPEFAQAGGMIGLIREDHKIRFDINQGAAERAGLKISARLLALARQVVRE